MAGHEHWQLDATTPSYTNATLVPAITSIWAADLLDRVRLQPNEAVLDIACGTGAVTRLAATRTRCGRLVESILIQPCWLWRGRYRQRNHP